jgi:hypothetical protein
MKISTVLFKKITLPLAIGLTIVMIAYASLVMGSQSNCITSQLGAGQALLGLKFGYELEYVHALLSNLDTEALKCYLRLLLIWDNLFPLLYGSMYIAWLSVIYKNTFKKYQWPVNLYPLIPVIMDWIENVFEAGLVRSFLNSGVISSDQVHISALITQIKWSASYLNYTLIIVGIILLLIKRYYQRRDQK